MPGAKGGVCPAGRVGNLISGWDSDSSYFEFLIFPKMALLLFLLATIQVDAYPIARTVNSEGEITYWVVEFSGYDCYGNLHSMREEVDVRGDGDKLTAIPMGIDQFMRRVEDEHVKGFLKALEREECESLKVLP